MFRVGNMKFEKTELGAQVTFMGDACIIQIEPETAAKIERWLRAWAGNKYVRYEWVVGDTTTLLPGRNGALILASASSEVRFEHYQGDRAGVSFASILDVPQIIAFMVRVQKAHSTTFEI